MKKIILTIITAHLFHSGFSQLNIGADAKWIASGNASVVIQDLSLVNNGNITAGTGSFKFTGVQNNSVSGTNMTIFYILEIAKTNNTKI